VFAVLAAASASGLAGQGLPAAPDEMSAVGWLEGEWAGSGWMEMAPGVRSEFRGTERVERRVSGWVLVIEGRYTAWMGPEAGDVPVHEALAVISYDAASGRYLFRPWTARGGNGEAHPATVEEDRMVWGYADPWMGRVRYTITRTADGAWFEEGHRSADDGASWQKFFEMTLTRVPEEGN
jgi:hypothetical protein